VSTTPELENAKKQSALVSTKKYKSEFERNKAKFTQASKRQQMIRFDVHLRDVSKILADVRSHELTNWNFEYPSCVINNCLLFNNY